MKVGLLRRIVLLEEAYRVWANISSESTNDSYLSTRKSYINPMPISKQ